MPLKLTSIWSFWGSWYWCCILMLHLMSRLNYLVDIIILYVNKCNDVMTYYIRNLISKTNVYSPWQNVFSILPNHKTYVLKLMTKNVYKYRLEVSQRLVAFKLQESVIIIDQNNNSKLRKSRASIQKVFCRIQTCQPLYFITSSLLAANSWNILIHIWANKRHKTRIEDAICYPFCVNNFHHSTC